MINQAPFYRAPLTGPGFVALPLGAVRPRGWLLDTLAKAAKAVTEAAQQKPLPDPSQPGHLEPLARELDGLLEAAFLLGDKGMMARATAGVKRLIDTQAEDGSFGGGDSSDWWPRIAILRPLMAYYTATGERAAAEFMLRFCAFMMRALDGRPLCDRAMARGADAMTAVIWLYNLTGKPWLINLLKKLEAHTLDWTGHFHSFPYTRALERVLPWRHMEAGMRSEGALSPADKPYFRTQYFFSRGEFVAAGLRQPAAVSALRSGQKALTAFETGHARLMKHHGLACGMFSCDEHLAGGNPSQGMHGNAICEMVHTLSSAPGTMPAGKGGQSVGDLMEKLVYNALLALWSGDMDAVQTVSQVNQVELANAQRAWYNAPDDGVLFAPVADALPGALAALGALAAFAARQWQVAKDGLALTSYAPSRLTWRVGNVPIRMAVDGNYPMSEDVKIKLRMRDEAEFTLYLRIPAWAEGAKVSLPGGEIMEPESNAFLQLRRVWKDGDVVKLKLPMEPRVTQWYHQSLAVEMGPLVMAHAPSGNTGSAGNSDAAWPWNMALVLDGEHPMHAVAAGSDCVIGGDAACPQDAPWPQVLVYAIQARDWRMLGADAGPPPIQPQLDAAQIQRIALKPYGFTRRRVAQFPRAQLRYTTV